MSSRAHRPADEGLGDFGASELAAAGIPSPLDAPVDGAALDGDVRSSERDAGEAADPASAEPSEDAFVSQFEKPAELENLAPEDREQPGPPPIQSLDAPTEAEIDAALVGVAASEAPDEPEVLGADVADEAEPPEPAFVTSVQHQAHFADSGDAVTPVPGVASASLSGDGPDLAAEPESIEVESRDIESVELGAPAPDEVSEAYAIDAAQDATEMTAAELALTLGSDEPTEGDPEGPAALAGDAGARAGERAKFDAPWVDEVPDPVTPYEQRISETVRVADLPPAEQLRGRVLANRYIAEEIAEQTPSSISYRAYHLALDRSVSVRILPRGLACPEETCQEVRRLAAIATELAHPNVAATLDFGVLPDGWPYLVTEQLSGVTLSMLLRQEGKFVLRRVLHIGKQLAAGLGAAHDAGLVHGLLNPDNILIVEPGTSAEVATLLGFGVSSARGAVPEPPRTGVFGVPFYVSPEQAGCRPLDARSDIYSLGVVLYELMTGRPPFTDGDFAGVLCQHLDDEAPPPSSRLRSPGALAKAMDAIIQRCLRKDPPRRYQSAAELAEDLVRLEAAAARTKRRPMPEVKRPTTTIHSPPPKAAEGTLGPEAKVIVHGDPEEDADIGPDSEPTSGQAAAPSAGRARPASTPVSGTGAAPREPFATSVARPATRAPRISVDQATIKISAVDRALITRPRPGAAISVSAALSKDEVGHGVGHWLWSRVRSLLGALKRFFGGGPNDAPRP